MRYTIITGASRGLGEAIVRELLEPGNSLICISRKENDDLIHEANKRGIGVEFIPYDLSDCNGIAELMDSIFSKVDRESLSGLALINNAGLIDPIKPMERTQDKELITNIHVNLLAPMLLVSSFMRNAKEMPVDKRVINISSGAGKHPIYGWSGYGASKAGVDLFSQTVALEQKDHAYPVQVVSFAPGIVDTDMQKQIRSSKEEDFIEVDRFREYKGAGKLLAPEKVAKVVVELLTTTDFPNGQVTSVHEFID